MKFVKEVFVRILTDITYFSGRQVLTSWGTTNTPKVVRAVH